jgi:hypothetical protein
VFPDPSVRWRAYPSIMDGIKAPPFVLDKGLWRGTLHLIVLEAAPFGDRAYGVQIACQIYGAFEEMIYQSPTTALAMGVAHIAVTCISKRLNIRIWSRLIGASIR